MSKTHFTLAGLATLLLVGNAAGYDVNKDLKNLGPDAHDLAIVLSGSENVTNTFDGYSSGPLGGRFNSVSSGPSAGGNTTIHWQNFNDGTDTSINNGQTIHVGYSTSDHSSSILDMYWTDPSGNRIAGSVIYNVTTGWTYRQNRFVLHYHNVFGAKATIRIRNVGVAVLPRRLALEDLNRFNAEIMDQLITVADGLDLEPGQEAFVEVPSEVPPGSAVVVVYEVLGSGGDAASVDFIQIIAEADSDGNVLPEQP